jgi:hypothetical protein
MMVALSQGGRYKKGRPALVVAMLLVLTVVL